MIELRPATIDDLQLLRHWAEQPHVIAAGVDDDWGWEVELPRDPDWREQLIAELDARPIGYLEIIDPAREGSHYWGEVAPNLRAIDIWIGEEADLGRGYGTEMMRLALARCFADPAVTAVLIDPLASNVRAHRFYERLGFRFVERRRFGDDDCFVYRLEAEPAGTMVGLIRGINVGRAKRVAMADLRALAAGLGYTEVRTLLNSGNVVFSAPGGVAAAAAGLPVDAPGVAAQLEAALAGKLGVSARIVVVTAAKLDEVVGENPFAENVADMSRSLVGFVADASLLSRVEPLTRRDWSPEALAVGGHAAYLWCPDGVATSPLVKAVGDALGDTVTMRNWATVLKLRDLSGRGG